jgi:hypothetical protein
MRRLKDFQIEELDGNSFADQATAQSKVLQPLASNLVFTLRGLLASGALTILDKRIIVAPNRIRR